MNAIQKAGFRVAVPILLVSVAVAVGLFFLLSWQPNREARRGFESKTESLARMLGNTIQASVEFDDAAAAQRDLGVGAQDKSVVYEAVVKANGSVLASVSKDRMTDQSALLKDQIAAAEADGVRHVAVPIVSQGKPIGWLRMGFSLDEVQRSFSGTRNTSLGVAGMVFLIGLLMAFLVGRSVANRTALLAEISDTSARLRAASENIQTACNEQAASTTEQAAAIEETRRTMGSLLEAAKRIADTSQQVFSNADHTSQTTLSITSAIKQLTDQAQRISDISEVIRSISDKSDLLALNASLEGTKAGEAGRGFALVAAEMRRLAESVMAAAREIKDLASNIRAASDGSVSAVMEGRQLAEKTSESAREITLVTVQQRNATEQVTSSMDEVSSLLTRSAQTTRGTESAAQALSALADQLATLTSRFAAQGDSGARS